MPRNGDAAAKKQPWYRRALGGLIPSARRAAIAAAPPPPPAAVAGTVERRPRWWWGSSLKTTSAAFAREVCICAPLCSYDGIMGIQVDAVAPTMMARSSAGISPSPPRRASPARSPTAGAAGGGGRRSPASRRTASPSPRSSRARAHPAPVSVAAPAPAAAAVEGPRKRVSFSGGESLWNDELVRRFVRAQEGMPRRGEIDMASRHRRRRWRAPGKSRLRRMSLAHVADDDEAGETNALA
uniref:Uncharacterized protein n=1 Tax=Oryza meridionalis TaxID=40149 RepID=A0A0E0CN17_9ORYZ